MLATKKIQIFPACSLLLEPARLIIFDIFPPYLYIGVCLIKIFFHIFKEFKSKQAILTKILNFEMYLYYSVNKKASNLKNFTLLIFYHGIKLPPCSFIKACSFIRISKIFHPACLLEPAHLIGRQEYIP